MRWLCSFVVVVAVLGCGKKEDASSKPIDAAAWKQKYGAEAEAFAHKLDAAVNLVKDLPATSVHVADPEVPFKWDRDTGPGWETTRIIMGYDLHGLPESGRDKGKSALGGDQTISVDDIRQSILELEDVWSLLAGQKPESTSTQGGGDLLMKQVRDLRYVLIGHEVSYKPGVIDVEAKTFTPGTYEGVVHVVDLQGLKLLGSVAFTATNTGSVESYRGNEKSMLRADLQSEAMKAFRAEWPKVFPNNALPPQPK